MKRFAFTMLELVFVIIVIAILAVLALPNFNRDLLQEATVQVAEHIRYAQHLAMNDDKFDPNNSTWYLNRWNINICQPAYRITSASDTVAAIDPLTHEVINGAVTKAFDLTKVYGISNISVTGGNCHIAFDEKGRPYAFAANPTSPVDKMIDTNITISLQGNEGNATITVSPVTGNVSTTYP